MSWECTYCNTTVNDGDWHWCSESGVLRNQPFFATEPPWGSSKEALDRLDTIIRLLKDIEHNTRAK
jgi:hypothetical protein